MQQLSVVPRPPLDAGDDPSILTYSIIPAGDDDEDPENWMGGEFTGEQADAIITLMDTYGMMAHSPTTTGPIPYICHSTGRYTITARRVRAALSALNDHDELPTFLQRRLKTMAGNAWTEWFDALTEATSHRGITIGYEPKSSADDF